MSAQLLIRMQRRAASEADEASPHFLHPLYLPPKKPDGAYACQDAELTDNIRGRNPAIMRHDSPPSLDANR